MLSELPLDVFGEVISYLNPSDLFKLCLTCKKCNNLSQPLLFREYVQPRYPYQSSIRPLLRTIIDQPDLGNSIKKFTIYAWDLPTKENDPNFDKPYDGGSQLEIDDRKVELVCDELFPDTDDDWRCGPEDYGGLLSLLFLTPNIRSLVIDVEDHKVFGLKFGYAFDKAMAKAQLLSRLEHIQIELAAPRGLERSDMLSNIFSLINLPSLHHLQIHYIWDLHPGQHTQSDRTGYLNLKHIEISCGVVCVESLTSLIKACKALESFRARFVYPEIYDTLDIFDFDLLSQAFHLHRDCLEHLIIDVMAEDSADELMDSVQGQLDLSSFTRLQFIHLPSYAFDSRFWTNSGPGPYDISEDENIASLIDLLPGSVKFLRIDSVPRCFHVAVKRMIEKKKNGTFGNLKGFVVIGDTDEKLYAAYNLAFFGLGVMFNTGTSIQKLPGIERDTLHAGWSLRSPLDCRYLED